MEQREYELAYSDFPVPTSCIVGNLCVIRTLSVGVLRYSMSILVLILNV